MRLRGWLRQGTSPGDFYGHQTYTADLLLQREDRLRWATEAVARAERELQTAVYSLVRHSLLDGNMSRPGFVLAGRRAECQAAMSRVPVIGCA